MQPFMASSLWSEQMLQVPPAVDDAHDLNFVDGAVIGGGMRLVQDEIRPFDEHTCGRANIGASRPKPGMLSQALDSRADGAHHPRRGG